MSQTRIQPAQGLESEQVSGQEISSPETRGRAAQLQAARGNQFVQELMGGFKGDPQALRGRMERSLGMSLRDVEVLGGPEGEAGVSSGAAATTEGGTIYLGRAFAQLALPQQEQVIAHEYGHIAQNVRGGSGGGDAEADAHRMASDALKGLPTRPTVGVTSHEAHNWELPSWDDVTSTAGAAWDSTGGALIDGAVELAVEQIASAAQLLEYIGTVGEAGAKLAIDWLAAHKVEILVGFLTLSPANALIVYVVRKLPTARLAEWMRSVDAKTVATVVGVVVAAGAVMVIGTTLLSLGSLAMPILRELSGPTLALLWQHLPVEMRQLASTLLVEAWPTGLGLALDGSIGATFGYPVYLGAEAFFEVSHFTQGSFKMRRGGVLKEAFDTGVGAGGFVGLGGGGGGRSGGGDGSGEGGLGIGAQAGAQFQAGLKQIVLQEFDFPVTQDSAFVSFLIAVMQADTSTSMSVLSLFSPELRRVNPISYNTMTKFEFKAYAEGNAGATAGLRTAGANTQEGGSTWQTSDGARDVGQQKWWQRWMSASVFGRIAGEAGVGFEVRNKAWTQDADGVRIPSEMEVDAYGEATAALAIVHAIPVISQSLPQLPSFDGGGGIKVTWTLTGGSQDTEPTVSAPTWKLYAKSGDFDRYNGAASETTLAVGNLTPETFSSLESFLANIQAGSEFKRRFSVSQELGRKYFLFAKRQGAFNVMLPAEYRAYGFRVEGYLDLESVLTADQVRSIFRSIASVGSSYAQGGAPLQQLYLDVTTFLSTGRGPAHVVSHLESMANTILSSVRKLHLHGLVGLSVAAGGQLSAGAKVRLHGSVGGQLTMDQDLLGMVRGQLTVEDIKKLIQGGVDAVSGALDVDGEGGGGGG